MSPSSQSAAGGRHEALVQERPAGTCLPVTANSDDLALVRPVAHGAEHGVGKDHLAPHQLAAGADLHCIHGSSGAHNNSHQVPDNASTIFAGRHALREKAGQDGCVGGGQGMRLTSSSLDRSLMQVTVAVCSFSAALMCCPLLDTSHTRT